MKVVSGQTECVCCAGGGPGACSGGPGPGAQRHLHDGHREGEVGPLRSAAGRKLPVQNQDHQGEPQPPLDQRGVRGMTYILYVY